MEMPRREESRTEPRNPESPRKTNQPPAGPFVPFRYSADAPRLNAAFVAQLLSQMMANAERPGSDLLAAYGEMPARRPVFDRLL